MGTKVTNSQICQAARGDETALAAVIARMLPSIRAEAVKAVCPGLEAEDAVQEGLIALLRAVQSYRAGQGPFEPYARRCIANAIRDARRAAGRKKHQLLNESVELEQQPASGQDPEEIAIRNEEYHLAMHNIHTRLSAFEKQVLLLFLDGYSYAAIAQKLAKPAKAVENAMVRVRRKLKAGRG